MVKRIFSFFILIIFSGNLLLQLSCFLFSLTENNSISIKVLNQLCEKASDNAEGENEEDPVTEKGEKEKEKEKEVDSIEGLFCQHPELLAPVNSANLYFQQNTFIPFAGYLDSIFLPPETLV
jgi:hypothetical protein